jgi:uncharacterized protein YggE
MDMADTARTIEVIEEIQEDVRPSGAWLAVTVSGARAFSSAAAAKQAVEVRRLAEALAGVGVSEDDLGLESVFVASHKGIIGSSSSATYHLSLRCRSAEQVPQVIDAVSAHKGATLAGLTWDYEQARSRKRPEWLRSAASRARAQIAAVAEGLGVALDGPERVRELRDQPTRFDGLEGARGYPSGAPRARSSLSEELGQLDLAPTRRMGLVVSVAYRVKGE